MKSATKFTEFSKVIDGVKITFTSQYYGRTTESPLPKFFIVRCDCFRGGLRQLIGYNYTEAISNARELAQLENSKA